MSPGYSAQHPTMIRLACCVANKWPSLRFFKDYVFGHKSSAFSPLVSVQGSYLEAIDKERVVHLDIRRSLLFRIFSLRNHGAISFMSFRVDCRFVSDEFPRKELTDIVPICQKRPKLSSIIFGS